MVFYPSKARIDPSDPLRVGKCDYCDEVRLFEELAPQMRWMGTQLQNTGYLVCPDCMDEPAPFERTLILPPDPPPAYSGRQVNFPVDSASQWTIQAPPGAQMFPSAANMAATLQFIKGFAPSLAGTSSMTSALLWGSTFQPSIVGVAGMTAPVT